MDREVAQHGLAYSDVTSSERHNTRSTWEASVLESWQLFILRAVAASVKHQFPSIIR